MVVGRVAGEVVEEAVVVRVVAEAVVVRVVVARVVDVGGAAEVDFGTQRHVWQPSSS